MRRPGDTTVQHQRGNDTFLPRVLLWSALTRLGVIGVFNATDAVNKLRLSPDSEKYDRVALEINEVLAAGGEVLYGWRDHGWYRFTALVYEWVGPYPWLIQVINAALGTVTVYFSYRLAIRTTSDPFVARCVALCVGFFPSFIYWSCLMLKDPAAILAMVLLVSAATELRHRVSGPWLAAAAASLVVFLGVRDYMFMVGILLTLTSLIAFPASRQGLTNAAVGVLVLGIGLPVALGYGVFAIGFFEESHYFDLEYINHVRVAMGDHGSGAMYAADSVETWGDDWLQNALIALKGVFYFFFVIDLTNVDSTRQMMALPEVVLLILLLPALWRGVVISSGRLAVMTPMLLFAFGVMAVYLSATTNMGALFRWKMQVMPFFVIFLAVGMNDRRRGTLYGWVLALLAWFSQEQMPRPRAAYPQ